MVKYNGYMYVNTCNIHNLKAISDAESGVANDQQLAARLSQRHASQSLIVRHAISASETDIIDDNNYY